VRVARDCFASGVKTGLDDRRDPSDGSWVSVQPPQEPIDLLIAGGVGELSLDRDLGLVDEVSREQTDYDVLIG
jgi:Cyclic-phosphate processing Receiver domain